MLIAEEKGVFMSDLGNLAAKFLQNNQGTGISKNDIIQAFKRVDEDFGNIKRNQKTSVWEDSDGDGKINKEEFINMMNLALSGTEKSSTEEDYEIIFNILNSNTEGKSADTLDSDEYNALVNPNITNKNITSYSLYTSFFGWSDEIASDISGITSSSVNTDKVDDNKDVANSVENFNNTQETVEDGTDDNFVSTGDISSIGVEEIITNSEIEQLADFINAGYYNLEDFKNSLTNEDFERLSVAVENANSENSVTSNDTVESDNSTSTSDENNELTKLKNLINKTIQLSNEDKYETPEDVISDWLKDGIINDEQASMLRNSYTVYSDKDESLINLKLEAAQINNPEITRDEIIEKLIQSGDISVPKESSSNKIQEEKITVDAKTMSDTLYSAMKGLGTKNAQVEEILTNENLSSADWVEIIKQYNQDYGSLVHKINDDFSGKKQDEYEEKLANVLIEQVKAGNEDALNLLCKEFYNSTAGMLGTCDEFIAAIFENAGDEVLAQLARKYSEVNPGQNIQDDIKGDFRNWFSSKNLEDKYVNAIINALAKNKM